MDFVHFTTGSEMDHLHRALLMTAKNSSQAKASLLRATPADQRNSLCIPDDKSGTGRRRRMYVYFRQERLTS